MIDSKHRADVKDALANKISMMYRKSAIQKESVSQSFAEISSFLKTETVMLEGFLSLYKVSKNGGMKRISQSNIKMGRKFRPSKDGNMTLTRSYDKQIISIVNFDQSSHDSQYFKIKAWFCDLQEYHFDIEDYTKFEETNKKLHEAINDYYEFKKDVFSELISVTFCNRCKWVELVYKEDLQLEEEVFCKKFAYFDVKTGEFLFEYGAKYPIELTNNYTDEQVEGYTIGLLSREMRFENNEIFHFYVVGDFWGD